MSRTRVSLCAFGPLTAAVCRAAARFSAGFVALAFGFLVVGCGSSIDSRLEEVRTLQDAGQFNDSIEPLRSILAQAPDLPEANHRLGSALVQTGQPSLAVWALEKSSKSQEYAVPSGILLATVFMALSQPEDAIRVATHVLEIDPQRPAALRILTEAQLATGQKEAALAGAKRLSEMVPDDYQAALLLSAALAGRGDFDGAEKSYLHVKELGAKSGDPVLAARGCLAFANFFDTARQDKTRAEKEYQSCLATYPTEPVALQLATQFYDGMNHPEKATELWKHAVSEAPENLSFRVMLAERVAATGKLDEAFGILKDAAESFETPAAWQALADLQRRHGRNQDALKSLEHAAQLAGGGDDSLRLAQGELYVELGQLDKAEEISAGITGGPYKDLLHGRILLAQGDPKGALEALAAGIRRWPDNAGARYLAGIAARDSGDMERALDELRQAEHASPGGSDAALALAKIYFDRGDYGAASQFASSHLQNRDPNSVEAYSIALRSAVAAKQFDTARVTLNSMKSLKGSESRVALEGAAIERAAKGPQASLAFLEASKLDLKNPENELVLRAVVEDLIATGHPDLAIARIDGAIAAHPQSASLVELRGEALARSGRTDEARAAFEKAITADPNLPRALIGLATLDAAAGDKAHAIELLDRAASLKPNDGVAEYFAAQLLLAQGKTADAEQRLREVVKVSPSNSGARNDLAFLLASRGTELDTALSLAEEARRLSPSTPDMIDTLGFVQLKRGDTAAAISSFEEALALRPKDPTIRYHLGLALAQAGNTERAVSTLQAAIAAGPFPEAEAAQQEIARLQQTPKG
ncbi:MAG TPA: tetratricopeptide repeat protein [Myxococcota bacterium]|nr:tetratricopeptide repeat protein [Myxococcota bacterium]